MGKIFYLVFMTFNPDHTVTQAYLAGHEYGSSVKCNEIADQIMHPEWMDWTKHDAACTTFAPTHAGMVFTTDLEQVTDDEEFYIKVR